MDSSQLGDWSRDKFSTDPLRRNIAASFEEFLDRKRWIVLLSWHHLEELLAVESDAIAEKRIQSLQALPLIAWPALSNGQEGLGSIVDIAGAEIRAALEIREASALEIRDHVTKSLFRVGTGEQALALYADKWRALQPYLWARRLRTQEVVAIRRSEASISSDTKIEDLMSGKLRSPEDAGQILGSILRNLSTEIKTRGDKRIVDPSAVAGKFIAQILEAAHPLPPTARELVLKGLQYHDVDAADLRPNMTLREVNELGLFRRRAKVATDSAGLEWSQVRSSVCKDQIPSMVIQDALRIYGQDQPERKGSDMTDEQLATLSSYATITYVDKRTKENFRRASKKSAEFRELVRDVRSVSSYANTFTD